MYFPVSFKKNYNLIIFFIKKIFIIFFSTRNRYIYIDTLADQKTRQKAFRPNFLFVFTIFFYFCYQLIMQPNWMLGGGMWAEMATNYFYNANSSSYIQQFFATDYGYIPFPQRLIAFIATLLNFPAASIPYFYTWSAIIFTGAMVGVFCLKQFRQLIKSDLLRFFVAISVLLISDFETRTFINFTYYGSFFVAIVTALAYVDDTENIPWWSWFIPILMISKPAVLAILPSVLIVGLICKSRFRWIAIVSVVLCFFQLLQIMVSQKAGVIPFDNKDISSYSKIVTAVQYFFGFLGGFSLGPNYHYSKIFSMLAGVLLFCISSIVVIKNQSPSRTLICVGLSLLFFNMLLNSFALNSIWNSDMSMLEKLPIHRHVIVGFLGCIFVISGLTACLSSFKIVDHAGFFIKNLDTLIFIVWFISVGWLSFSGKISKEPESPIINNSQWQAMAKVIDSGQSTFCVPIDPFSWIGGIYGRNCSLINPSMEMGAEYRSVEYKHNIYSIEFNSPSWVMPHYVNSIGILVKPSVLQNTKIVATGTLYSSEGAELKVFGDRELSATGGLILLSGVQGTKIKEVSSVKINFNMPVQVRYTSQSSSNAPAIIWMGQLVSNAAKKYEGVIVHQAASGRGKDDGLFLVKNGLRFWINNFDWIRQNGFNESDIKLIDSVEFNSIYEDPLLVQH